MNKFPSNTFLAKVEVALLLPDPDEGFVFGLRRSLVEHSVKPSLKSIGHEKTIKKALFPISFSRKASVVIGLALVVLITTFIFRQPVLAAASRLFGFSYFPQVGFIVVDTTSILKNPVKQEHAGKSITVVNGLAMQDHTILWLEYSAINQPVDGAWLETPAGGRFSLLGWKWDSNQPNTKLIRLEFPSLPADETQTTLSLLEGWRLPLNWIPVSQSTLPDVSVIPYTESNNEPTQATKTSYENCDEKYDLKFCLIAATTTIDNTSVLMEALSSNPKITPGDLYQGLVWSTATDPVTLRDEQGMVYPMIGQQNNNLTFPVISTSGQKITLIIPSVLATVAIPEQIIRVDTGENPQPGQVISLNSVIQVLGTTVHFRKATLVGDGVNSLRLTLTAEPVETKNGITPLMLQMSKPERVDDLYGNGNLEGSKALFVELIRPQGKISGVLELPIAEATVILSGPFEFTFSLSQIAPQLSPTPVIAFPDNFSPEPTSTSLALDTYHYFGKLPKSGELLFTLIEGENTSLFAFNPAHPSKPEQIAILPGQVYQVYLHPDLMGIDYLVGEQHIDQDYIWYRSAKLYTLQFANPTPQLLVSFPRGIDNSQGTEITATWSFDGRFMAFQEWGIQQKPGDAFRKIGWVDMVCRETGECKPQELPLTEGLDLYNPQFSFGGYYLMLEGSNPVSGSGASDIFMVDFGLDGIPGNIVNLSNSDQIDERLPHWNPKSNQVVALCPANTIQPKKAFCFFDPITGRQWEGANISLNNPQDFQVSSQGDWVIGLDINNNSGGKGQLELRRLNFDGTIGVVLASSRWSDGFNLSEDGNFLAYSGEQSKLIGLISLQTGALTSVHQSEEPGSISWMGWVK